MIQSNELLQEDLSPSSGEELASASTVDSAAGAKAAAYQAAAAAAAARAAAASPTRNPNRGGQLSPKAAQSPAATGPEFRSPGNSSLSSVRNNVSLQYQTSNLPYGMQHTERTTSCFANREPSVLPCTFEYTSDARLLTTQVFEDAEANFAFGGFTPFTPALAAAAAAADAEARQHNRGGMRLPFEDKPPRQGTKPSNHGSAWWYYRLHRPHALATALSVTLMQMRELFDACAGDVTSEIEPADAPGGTSAARASIAVTAQPALNGSTCSTHPIGASWRVPHWCTKTAYRSGN